ncbi:MAG: bacteriohemerythrin [Gammaproteobacteria bacterium]
MNILTWNDQLILGIESVDRQHKQLVDLINQLDEAVALGSDKQTINGIVKALVDYTIYHFRHEEELMQKTGYKDEKLDEHVGEHLEFVDKIKQIQNDIQHDTTTITKDLLDFLVDWMCNHILKTDKHMAEGLIHGVNADRIKFDMHKHVDILNSTLYSALRESEIRFRELANDLPALIWISNVKAEPIFCNRFWFKTFGIDPGPITNNQWLNIIHPEDREKVTHAYQLASTRLEKCNIEYRICKPKNGILWILETAGPRIRQNGEFAGLMGCGMDITAQKQAEETLLEINQQLEDRVQERTQALIVVNRTLECEKNHQTALNKQLKEAQAHLVQSEKLASIGQLAAGVAHEINNPLGYIYSNLNSLKQYIQDMVQMTQLAKRAAEQLPPDHPEYQVFLQFQSSIDWDFMKDDAIDLVNESLEGAVRAKKIVQDLRDFSRIEKRERENFDIEAGIDATLNIVNNELKYKAEVIKAYGGLKPFECVGAQLNQVFMNLLVNAAQAIDEFGKITVRTGYQGSDWLWVEVEDTGKGMSEETKAKIFDPFFTTKPVGKGTGLGLSLSYNIVKDHDGRIEVDSTLGKGTRFRILLPLKPSQQETT